MDFGTAEWLLFGASLLSTLLGIVLFFKTPVLAVMDGFMLTLGQGINTIGGFRLSEDERIEVSQKYTLRIVGRLLLLLLVLAVVIAVAASPFFFLDYDEYTLLELTVYIVGGLVLGSVIYFWLFHKPGSEEYPASKQLLFYITLGSPAMGKFNHRMNQLLYGKRTAPERGVMVTGLARAGTTTMLHYLSRHPKLQSITYRHMPFLMGGRVWRRMNSGKSEAKERSHQDGIMVSLDSPEAFDEYYWRIILREGYYKNDALHRHELTPKDIARFEQYISQQVDKGKYYLSKNNNFILRAASYATHRPAFVIALIFREPVSHAKSLLRQQQLQTEEQEKEPFVLDYMNWLGHNEFGKGRMDFALTGEAMQHTDKLSLNYWLERWIEYYSYALSLDLPQFIYISNAQIAEQPLESVNRVLAQLELQPLQEDYPTRTPKPPKAAEGADEALLQQAHRLYEQLCQKAGAAPIDSAAAV